MGFNTKGGSKPQYSTLNVKMSRSCNVVSFCKQQPQLLAAGLDKVRNDPCLLIWDISQSIDSYCSTPASGSQTPTAASVTPHSSSYQFPRADNNDFSKISSDIVFSGKISDVSAHRGIVDIDYICNTDRSRYNVGISNPDQFIPSSSAARYRSRYWKRRLHRQRLTVYQIAETLTRNLFNNMALLKEHHLVLGQHMQGHRCLLLGWHTNI